MPNTKPLHVPEAAVDLAARRCFLDTREDDLPYAWSDGEKGVLVDDETKDVYRDAVRPHLAAALPLLEEEWENRLLDWLGEDDEYEPLVAIKESLAANPQLIRECDVPLRLLDALRDSVRRFSKAKETPVAEEGR